MKKLFKQNLLPATWRVSWSLLILLLVACCADKDSITELAKEAARVSFLMGYECAKENNSKEECELYLEKELRKVGK